MLKLAISAEKVSSGMITDSIVLVSDIIRSHCSVRCIVSIIVLLWLAEDLLGFRSPDSMALFFHYLQQWDRKLL